MSYTVHKVHKLIGKNRHDENINLCGRTGIGTNIRRAVTCNKCRIKLHMKKLADQNTKVSGF